MQTFPAIRLVHRRHPIAVRGMLLLLLAMVTFATMPKWVAHSHGAGHNVAVALTVVASADPQHDDGDEPVPFSAETAHAHVHYLGGVAVTLPAALVDVCPPAAIGGCCPPWHSASMLDVPLASLHRPPIV